jgi:hypothetical protein
MGVIFIVLLVVGGIVLGYTYHVGKGLDKESKEYTDMVVPKILSGWDADMFDQYADHDAMKDANTSPQQMAEIFGWSRTKLGKMTEYMGSEGQAFIHSFNGVTTTGAQYTAFAKFEHGEAKILVTLSKNGDEWKIAGFNVNSPSFANAPNPYR